MDRPRRPGAHQDQAQRRGPALGRRAHAAHRPRHRGRAGPPRRHGLVVLPRLQRALPERGLRPRLPAPGPRGRARGFRAHPLRRAADRARPAREPRERHARGGEAAPGRHRRVADRPGEPAPRARDGLQRRGAEGLQGTEPGGADGGGRAEVRHVPVRAGPHLPGRVADPLGRDLRARARGRRHRGQRAPIRPRRERAVGRALSRASSTCADGYVRTAEIGGPGLGIPDDAVPPI